MGYQDKFGGFETVEVVEAYIEEVEVEKETVIKTEPVNVKVNRTTKNSNAVDFNEVVKQCKGSEKVELMFTLEGTELTRAIAICVSKQEYINNVDKDYKFEKGYFAIKFIKDADGKELNTYTAVCRKDIIKYFEPIEKEGKIVCKRCKTNHVIEDNMEFIKKNVLNNPNIPENIKEYCEKLDCKICYNCQRFTYNGKSTSLGDIVKSVNNCNKEINDAIKDLAKKEENIDAVKCCKCSKVLTEVEINFCKTFKVNKHYCAIHLNELV